MLVRGTVVDPERVVPDGAVVTEGGVPSRSGEAEDLVDRCPDHEHRRYDVVMPGVVGAHVHSGQRLGRGVADDTALLEWLYENVLPMEAAMGPGAMEIAATYRLPRTDRERRHYLHRPPLGRPRRPAVRGRGEVGIRGLLGKVLMDRDAPEGLREESDEALAEEYHVRIHVHASENLEEVARVRERTGMGNVG